MQELLNAVAICTALWRKGPVFREDTSAGGLQVTTIDAMPKAPPAAPGIALVDVHFATVSVEIAKAMQWRTRIIDHLKAWPSPGRLEQGPSYIEIGGVLGDQGQALRLMGLGEVLGFLKVMTPAHLGVEGPHADSMAGAGFVMISGFRPEAPAP